MVYNGTPTAPEVAYKINEVIERRNHAGEFENPEHKIGTFFRVNTTLINA